MSTAVLQQPEVEYPSSDGKPMAETDIHRTILNETVETLKGHFAKDSNVYVSGNLLVYYVEGNPQKVRSPDTFVVWGVPNHNRPIFKTWEEGAFPRVVIEFTSKTTKNEDLTDKYEIYQDVWGVQEYFLFDPFEEYLDPSLLGYRRTDDDEFDTIPLNEGRLFSKELGLFLFRDEARLGFLDRDGNRVVLPEVAARIQEEAARKKAERERDLAWKGVDIERQKRADAEARADAARTEADAATARAESERLAREQLERELAELRSRLP